MASFGKVLDLFDDRCLELQDVVGNVEPMPTLVPYDEYKQNVLVYRTDTSHDIYMALMQEFTERKARETGKELWTWCVQWQVEDASANQTMAYPSSPKKARLESKQPELVPANAKPQQRKAPAINIIERRVIDPDLMLQEDMLRILIDIVQVDSTIVPNFIEFLYRWIDFYEGDGKALKAAMRWEIPSLWEFEYHPLVLPTSSKPPLGEEDKAGTGKSTHNKDLDELKASSPTKKMREKPNLASLEDKIEQSERLQYREVHYGIKPPKLWDPLPPLINLPRDQRKRTKYYAACFKSRQRAFNLLIEAGITTQQINNYKKLQELHPRDTPQDGDGGGLRHYQKDAKAAQTHYVEKEKEMAVRAKHMEIAISNKLAFEAQLAACSNVVEEDVAGVPLIPATPSYASRPDMAAEMLRRIQLKRGVGEMRINVVPKPLLGLLQSKLFKGARDSAWVDNLQSAGMAKHTWRLDSESLGSEETGSSDDSDGGEHDTDSDDSGNGGTTTATRGRYSIPPTIQPPMAVPRQPALHAAPIAPLASTSLFVPSPTMASQSASIMPSPSQSANHSVHGTSEVRQRMQMLARIGIISQSTADGEPWSHAQITGFINSLTGQERLRVMQIMSPLYTADMASPPITSFLTVPAAGYAADGASGLMSSQSTSGTVHTSWNNPAQVSGPMLQPYLPPHPLLPPYQSQAPTGPSPFQAPTSLGAQMATTLPLRPPGLPTAQSTFTLAPSQPPPQRRIANDPAGLSALLSPPADPSTASISNSQYITSTPPYPSLAPRPSLPQLPRLPPLPPLPTLPTHPQPFNLPSPSPQQPQNQQQQHPHIPPPCHFPLPSPTQQPLPLPQTQTQTLPHPRPNQPTPILIYLPASLRPGNTLGPAGHPLGNAQALETDALLLGHCTPGTSTLVLTRALFLPLGIWDNVLRRVRSGAWAVLETYVRGGEGIAHRAVYGKLALAHGVMGCSGRREEELTKRWRVSRGPMRLVERGAVWEGWGVGVEKGVEMGAEERRDAVGWEGWVDGGVGGEAERRRREIEELMAEEEEEGEDEEEEMGC